MLYTFDIDGTLVEGFLETTVCDACGGKGTVRLGDALGNCLKCKGKGATFGEHVAYEIVNVLPGRREALYKLAQHGGTHFALATNQGGVAMGYQRATEVYDKIGRVIAEFECFYGCPLSVHVAMGHPQAKDPYWRRADELRKRKPNGGMIEDAMTVHGVNPEETVYVGDLATDRGAAEAAGVRYVDAEEFFESVLA